MLQPDNKSVKVRLLVLGTLNSPTSQPTIQNIIAYLSFANLIHLAALDLYFIGKSKIKFLLLHFIVRIFLYFSSCCQQSCTFYCIFYCILQGYQLAQKLPYCGAGSSSPISARNFVCKILLTRIQRSKGEFGNAGYCQIIGKLYYVDWVSCLLFLSQNFMGFTCFILGLSIISMQMVSIVSSINALNLSDKLYQDIP